MHPRIFLQNAVFLTSTSAQEHAGTGSTTHLSSPGQRKLDYGRSTNDTKHAYRVAVSARASTDRLTIDGDGADPRQAEWATLRATIVQYVMRRGQPAHVAEDVAQETCIKLLAYCEQQQPASMYALAFRIAATCLVDIKRKERGPVDELDDGHPCEAPLADRLIDGRRRVSLFQSALAAMPALRRKAFEQRRIEKRSHAQIAADLGISVASVEKHVSRGLQDMRKALSRADLDWEA